MPKDKPMRLHYRLWIHRNGADEQALALQWDAYNLPSPAPEKK